MTPETVASCMRRLDEAGPQALVQLREPVNRFPDLVRYLVQQLKVLCPSMGKVKLAEILARAGLHLGKSTVGRILAEKPAPRPQQALQAGKTRVVTSRYPNHVWLVDLTTLPIGHGFWCSWFPGALPQRWPFCHWLAVVVDHFLDVSKVSPSLTMGRTPSRSADSWAARSRSWVRHRVT